jgi:hypothetical protein
MIIKYCRLETYDLLNQPTNFTLTKSGLIKLASQQPLSEDLLDFLEKLNFDEKRYHYKLVTALGAAEYWGQNRNGDIFYESALTIDHPDFGYKSFLNAGLYRHHKNTDPTKSLGKVLYSTYNKKMHRVELVLAYDINKLKEEDSLDLLDIQQPEFSMAAKLPWDRCTVCCDNETYFKVLNSCPSDDPHLQVQWVLNWMKNHGLIRGVSRTLAEYCEHKKYMKNKILDNGIQVGMINDYPRFFDLSQVTVGAAPEAKEMIRLSHNTKNEKFITKVATLLHKATINKKVPSTESDIKLLESNEPDLPLEKLEKYDFDEILTTLKKLGIVLKPHEFQYLYLKLKEKNPFLAKRLLKNKIVFSQKNVFPNELEIKSEKINPELIEILSEYIEKRSCYEPYLSNRIYDIYSGKYIESDNQFIEEKFDDIASKYLGYRINLLDNNLIKQASLSINYLNNYFLEKFI